MISRSLLEQQPSITSISSKLTPSYTAANLEQHQADMAMSALYLHNINFRTRRTSRLAQLSGYRFQTEEETQGERERERDLLLPDISS